MSDDAPVASQTAAPAEGEGGFSVRGEAAEGAPVTRRQPTPEEIAAKPWLADILRAVEDSRKPAQPIEQGEALSATPKAAGKSEDGPIAPPFDEKKHQSEIAADRQFWEKVSKRKDEDKAEGIAAMKAYIQAVCIGDPLAGAMWAAELGFGDLVRSYCDQMRSSAEKQAESYAYAMAASNYLAGWAEADQRRKSGAEQAHNAEQSGLKRNEGMSR